MVCHVEADLERTKAQRHLHACRRQATYDGHEETDVGLRQPVAYEVVLAREDLLEAVERVKELVDGLFVGLLGSRKAGLVDPVCGRSRCNNNISKHAFSAGSRTRLLTVHGVVDPSVELVDLAAQLLGVQVDRGLVGGEEMIERGVEDAYDLRALIIDDRLGLRVPQHRDREPVCMWIPFSRVGHYERTGDAYRPV